MSNTTLFGIDKLLTQVSAYKEKNIALASNLASVTKDQIHARIALKEAGFQIKLLFAPEHGFDAKGDDGAYIAHQIDQQTQIPIVSLYSEKLAPTKEDLNDIDLVIIDLPDIGARFYTYLWTMTHIMESCEKYRVPVLVLDRPNPMAKSIDLAEGPILSAECSSFIGRFPIPVTHHCTFGELAQYFKQTYYPDLNLEVLKMDNWSRNKNNGYSFIPTSPAIQKRETVYTYAGACLFEGLNINEGRGSSHPFQQFGAPWIDAKLLFDEVHKNMDTSHTAITIIDYIPTHGLYEGERCYGLRITPHEPETFLSLTFFIQIIEIIYQTFPDLLQERNYLTNVNPTGQHHLDLLLGIPNAYQQIKEGKIYTSLTENDWKNKINMHLLYN